MLSGSETAALLAGAERITSRASLILDVTDGYASSLGVFGPNTRTIGMLRFSFSESGSGTRAAQRIDPALRISTIINPSGYQLWFGEREDGGPPPDPGSYRLRIDSDYYAPFVSANPVQVPTADTAVPCVLQPGYAYPFAGGGLAAAGAGPTLLRGALQNFDGTGKEGATVAVTAGATTLEYLTDATGQFVFVIQDSTPAVSLTITDAAGAKTSLADIAVMSGATTTIPQTVITGRVVSTVLGATVQLSAPSVAVPVAPDGTWRIVLPLDQKPATVTVTATVPGQRKRSQSRIKITPGQVVTLPPFVFTP